MEGPNVRRGNEVNGGGQAKNGQRAGSFSQASETSQTAQEFIADQLQLEADAREILPYQFDTCTQPLGQLRQELFSCLTCNPPPSDPSEGYQPAGVCYSCSISCHGEHELVELFTKRNFVCDCGTTRLPSTSPCTLRVDETTGEKSVHSTKPAESNEYNQNYQNRFCGCGRVYDAHSEKGTMFQCVGLGTVQSGGCGEDWWHAECILGLDRDNVLQSKPAPAPAALNAEAIEKSAVAEDVQEEEEYKLPPGFPDEDDFARFICFKCTTAYPWIKRYAGTNGFLPGVPFLPSGNDQVKAEAEEAKTSIATNGTSDEQPNKKRKLDNEQDEAASISKKVRAADEPEATAPEAAPVADADSIQPKSAPESETKATTTPSEPYHTTLPEAPSHPISLFMEESFREHFCRCDTCFPQLAAHPQLLEEEETYEQPLSESEDDDNGGSLGSRSLLDRGEAALSNVDRVRAIEGVMVYNHLKEKVKGFLKPFAESGQAVGAEDIKAYFEKLRGDEEAIRAAAGGASAGAEDDGGGDGAYRKAQGGY